jgi:hypothetical protein
MRSHEYLAIAGRVTHPYRLDERIGDLPLTDSCLNVGMADTPSGAYRPAILRSPFRVNFRIADLPGVDAQFRNRGAFLGSSQTYDLRRL